MHIFFFGMDSDFNVDWRLSHRRSVNLVVVVAAAASDDDDAASDPDDDDDDAADDATWVSTGIDIIFPLILS